MSKRAKSLARLKALAQLKYEGEAAVMQRHLAAEANARLKQRALGEADKSAPVAFDAGDLAAMGSWINASRAVVLDAIGEEQKAREAQAAHVPQLKAAWGRSNAAARIAETAYKDDLADRQAREDETLSELNRLRRALRSG